MNNGTQMNIGRVHTEWVTANLSRAYPLDDSTGGLTGTLPCRLLADAFVLIYGDVEETTASLYISKVTTSSTEIVFELAGKFNGVPVEFGPVATFDRACAIGTPVSFELSTDDVIVTGKFVAGDLRSGDDIPASLVLSATTGSLFRGCYRVAPRGLHGIKVDDVVYTGIVELVAGDGVDIDVTTTKDPDGQSITTLVFSVPDYNIPLDNDKIINDSTLMKEAIKEYGEPIRSINFVVPDKEGNINIVADEQSTTTATIEDETDEEDDGSIKDVKMQLAVTELGPGTIQVTLTRPQECESTEILQSLLTMIQQLNQRANTLDTAITEIDKAQANLASRLTGLA